VKIDGGSDVQELIEHLLAKLPPAR